MAARHDHLATGRGHLTVLTLGAAPSRSRLSRHPSARPSRSHLSRHPSARLPVNAGGAAYLGRWSPPNPREPAMLGHDHALSGALAFAAAAPMLHVGGVHLAVGAA